MRGCRLVVRGRGLWRRISGLANWTGFGVMWGWERHFWCWAFGIGVWGVRPWWMDLNGEREGNCAIDAYAHEVYHKKTRSRVTLELYLYSKSRTKIKLSI